jgi:lysophospholipase L1-like esterase
VGPSRFERFVVIGDSTAEGVGDPDADGGHRGFGNRLAERIAAHQGVVAYANLAVSGYGAREIKERQLAAALALRPDLTAIMAGMNDLLRASFDPRAIADEIATMQRELVAARSVVLSFTLPDVAHRLVMPPFARFLSRRTRALNAEIRRVSTGVHLIDLATYPVATDPRMWNRDRLHGSPDGHERIAAACAWALGLPDADVRWRDALPPAPPLGVRARLAEDLAWAREYLAPWLWHRARGRPGVEQRRPKRPELRPLSAP